MRARVIGRLGKDAEMVDIKGKQYLRLMVAEYIDKDTTEWREALMTNIFQADRLKKGALVLVEGFLTASTSTAKNGGEVIKMTVWGGSAEVIMPAKKRDEPTRTEDLPFA